MPQTIIVTITSILKHGKYAVLFSLSKATDGTCFEYMAKRWLPPWGTHFPTALKIYSALSMDFFICLQLYSSTWQHMWVHRLSVPCISWVIPSTVCSFSSVIIMLKIQVVIGTNVKQKIRAASCISGGQRITETAATHKPLATALVSSLIQTAYTPQRRAYLTFPEEKREQWEAEIPRQEARNASSLPKYWHWPK